MLESEDVARRFAIGYQYLLVFRRHMTDDMASSSARVEPGVSVLLHSGLIPEAECVTVETIAETMAHQPADVRAVLQRLVEECQQLATSPAQLAEVVAIRRSEYPGVLEGRNKEPIRWSIARTKKLSEIKASDIPRGLSAEDVAIDDREPGSS